MELEAGERRANPSFPFDQRPLFEGAIRFKGRD